MGSICLILDSSTKLQSTLSRNKKKYFLQIFQNKIFWDYFMVWSVSNNSNRSNCIFVNSFDLILYDFLENLWQGYGTFLFQAHYFIKSSKLSHTVFFFSEMRMSAVCSIFIMNYNYPTLEKDFYFLMSDYFLQNDSQLNTGV